MKTVLLIDDLRVFLESDEDTELHVARTVQEALTVLKEQPDKRWDEIWFDHDLGMVDGNKVTSLPVADYLAERAFFGNPVDVGTVFIHSDNPAGVNALDSTFERFHYRSVRMKAKYVFGIDKALYEKALQNEKTL